MIISEVSFENREVNLCPKDYKTNQNVFSIIVGRNGSGKSRVFQKIILMSISSKLNYHNPYSRIRELLGHEEYSELLDIDETGCLTLSEENHYHKILIREEDATANFPFVHISDDRKIEKKYNLFRRRHEVTVEHFLDNLPQEKIENPPKIIAVSSSPFDKFPILDENRLELIRAEIDNHYQYFGARTNNKSTKNYMRSKLDQLGASFIHFFLKNRGEKNELQPLFSYLGFKTKFTVILKFPFHFSFESMLHENNEAALNSVRSARFFKGKDRNRNLTDYDSEKILKSVRRIYSGLYSNPSNGNFNYRGEIHSFELDLDNQENIDNEFLEDFSVLVSYDLIDLVNIEFTKILEDKTFFLTDASSGELSILFNVLAIAGSISDNSVILIDEPELSLHPEWQMDFLPLIHKIFSNYKHCHFIIATHSPGIVSSIPTVNSFVINLENNPTLPIRGDIYALESSDFHLAETFNSPGHKNKYLIREIVNVLSKLSEGENLSNELLLTINKLINFDSQIHEGDPVKKLLSTLIKAVEILKNE